MRSEKGITILEIIIVVLIIGIMVTLAIPQYEEMRERAVDAEAYRMISLIIQGQRLYYAEYETYVRIPAVAGGGSRPEAWGKLGFDGDPNTEDKYNFWYTIPIMVEAIPWPIDGPVPEEETVKQYFRIIAKRKDGAYSLIYRDATGKIQKRMGT